MLKIAIVGCGKIADDHAQQIRRVRNAQLTAFCDAEPLMAEQMRDRFGGLAFADLDRLLEQAKPDVVHITTPPTSHFRLAMRCLEAGCHVFVEKPFTMNADEARRLLQTATARGLNITVGHNLQFSDPAIRMRELVASGFLGGRPVHLESYYSYDLGDRDYARAFLSDSSHWVRCLPGGLLQNVISHGLGRIAEYMQGDDPRVVVHGFTSPFLRSLGEHTLRDELRVIVYDEHTTAYFTFSSQIRPQVSEFRVFGPRNGVLIDDAHNVMTTLRGAKYKSYLDMLVPPLAASAQLFANGWRNMRRLVTADLHMGNSMKVLIERFYQSIREGQAVPIPYREILVTAQLMDAVFAALAAQRDNDNIDEPEMARTS
jgi:predicted dehydrogenase